MVAENEKELAYERMYIREWSAEIGKYHSNANEYHFYDEVVLKLSMISPIITQNRAVERKAWECHGNCHFNYNS